MIYQCSRKLYQIIFKGEKQTHQILNDWNHYYERSYSACPCFKLNESPNPKYWRCLSLKVLFHTSRSLDLLEATRKNAIQDSSQEISNLVQSYTIVGRSTRFSTRPHSFTVEIETKNHSQKCFCYKQKFSKDQKTLSQFEDIIVLFAASLCKSLRKIVLFRNFHKGNKPRKTS